MRIAVAGPPHSGKSVFELAIRQCLGQYQCMRIPANPDGEGDWIYRIYGNNPDLAKVLRTKGQFTAEFVQHKIREISNADVRFTMVDLGGRMSQENEQFLALCEGMIVVSSNPQTALEWIEFARKANPDIRILGVIHSSLDPHPLWYGRVDGEVWEFEGLIAPSAELGLFGLERGYFTSAPALDGLVEYLLAVVPEVPQSEPNIIDLPAVGRMIGKAEAEIRAGEWQLSELARVAPALALLQNIHRPWLVDGFARQFVVIPIVAALQPREVWLRDPKVSPDPAYPNCPWVREKAVLLSVGKVPSGNGNGPFGWIITPGFQGGTLVQYNKGTAILVKPEELDALVPPAVSEGSPVFLSGLTSNWAAAEIALAYGRVCPAVYVYRPGIGFICVITRSNEIELGSVIVADPV